jgi:hypothetical protein
MSLRIKQQNQVVSSFENLMNDDLVIVDELTLLASNIRRDGSCMPIWGHHIQ